MMEGQQEWASEGSSSAQLRRASRVLTGERARLDDQREEAEGESRSDEKGGRWGICTGRAQRGS